MSRTLLSCLLVLLAISACGPPPPPAELPEPLVIHTDVDAYYLEALIRHFERTENCRVEVHYTLDTLDPANAEKGPELKGDVIIARDAGLLLGMKGLQDLPAGTTEGIDADFHGAQWCGLFWRLMVVVHPRKTRGPASLLDVEGTLGWPGAPKGARNHAGAGWAASWIATHGVDKVDAWLADRQATPYAGRRALAGLLQQMILDLNDPPAAVLVDHDLWTRHLRDNPKHGGQNGLQMTVPDPKKATWSLSAIALNATLARPELARKFVALATSREGQAKLATGDGNLRGNYQFPVREGVDTRVEIAGIADRVAKGTIVRGPAPAALKAHRAAGAARYTKHTAKSK